LRAEEYVFELGAEGWVVRMLIDDYGKTASTLSLFAERAWRGAV